MGVVTLSHTPFPRAALEDLPSVYSMSLPTYPNQQFLLLMANQPRPTTLQLLAEHHE